MNPKICLYNTAFSAQLPCLTPATAAPALPRFSLLFNSLLAFLMKRINVRFAAFESVLFSSVNVAVRLSWRTKIAVYVLKF